MAKTNKPKDNLSAAEATLFREKVRNVVDSNRGASIELCQLVYESDVTLVRVNGELKYCWEAWGYKSWEDFLGEEMDLHLQTAIRLKKVWEVFYVDLVGAWNPELLLGITKMRLLSIVDLTPRNVEGWLKKAKKMNCRLLQAAVFETAVKHSFAVSLTGSQMTQIKRTLAHLRGTLNNGDKLSRGELLMAVCKQWRDANRIPLRSVA